MIHDYLTINTPDNEKISCVIKESGSPIWLFVTHGLAEYAERHSYLIKLFSQYFNVCLYDLRGHGKSSGRRAYADDFNQYVDDLDLVVQHVREKYQVKRYILLGHSMGGLITSAYMQSRVSKDFYPEKVFLSSPLVAAPGLGVLFKYAPIEFTRFLANIKSGLPLGIIRNDLLSHDDRVYQSVKNDELMLKKVHSHLLLQLMKASKEVFSRPLRIECPLYCAIGTDDKIVDPNALIDFFSNVEKGCQLLKVEGGYHELHNEVEKYRTPYLAFQKEALLNSLFKEGV